MFFISQPKNNLWYVLYVKLGHPIIKCSVMDTFNNETRNSFWPENRNSKVRTVTRSYGFRFGHSDVGKSLHYQDYAKNEWNIEDIQWMNESELKEALYNTYPSIRDVFRHYYLMD